LPGLCQRTWLELGDALAAPYDNTRCLVANDAVALKDKRAYPPRLPEMHVGPVFLGRVQTISQLGYVSLHDT
jgi:hypothetical protein